MSKTMSRVVVTCQYQENYGSSEGIEHWKIKGSRDFHVCDIPKDLLLDYPIHEVMAAVSKLADTVIPKANSYTKFTDPELAFTNLDDETLKRYKQLVEQHPDDLGYVKYLFDNEPVWEWCLENED